MSFSASFSVSQVIGFPQNLVVTDTSVGSDGAIANRRLSILTAYNTYLVPSGNTDPKWIDWAYVDPSITVSGIFPQDFATFIVVQWRDSGGNVLYSAQNLTDQTLYGEQQAFNLCQMMTANPDILRDNNFIMNSLTLGLVIENSEIAVSIGSNIYDAQAQLNIEQNYINNANLYF